MSCIRIFETEYSLFPYLPYERKVQAAEEYVAMSCIIDEELSVAYKHRYCDLAETMIVLKYYAGIDMDKYDTFDVKSALFDAVWDDENNREAICEIIEGDFALVQVIADRLLNEIITKMRRTGSLEYKLIKELGGIFTGEGIAETVAKATDVNESLLGLVEKINAIQKQGGGNDITRGNVLSFAKKGENKKN